MVSTPWLAITVVYGTFKYRQYIFINGYFKFIYVLKILFCSFALLNNFLLVLNLVLYLFDVKVFQETPDLIRGFCVLFFFVAGASTTIELLEKFSKYLFDLWFPIHHNSAPYDGEQIKKFGEDATIFKTDPANKPDYYHFGEFLTRGQYLSRVADKFEKGDLPGAVLNNLLEPVDWNYLDLSVKSTHAVLRASSGPECLSRFQRAKDFYLSFLSVNPSISNPDLVLYTQHITQGNLNTLGYLFRNSPDFANEVITDTFDKKGVLFEHRKILFGCETIEELMIALETLNANFYRDPPDQQPTGKSLTTKILLVSVSVLSAIAVVVSSSIINNVQILG